MQNERQNPDVIEKPHTSRLAKTSFYSGLIGLILAGIGSYCMYIWYESLGLNRAAKLIGPSLLLSAMLFSVIAFFSGIMGLVVINFFKSKPKGFGLAVLGTLFALVSAVIMPALGSAYPQSYLMVCAANMSGLGKVISSYSQDYNGQLPTLEKWREILLEELWPKQFICSAVETQDKNLSSYAINKNLQSTKFEDIPADIVLLFECNLTKNPTGGPELLTSENHKNKGSNIVFGDLHVEFIRTEHFENLRWKP